MQVFQGLKQKTGQASVVATRCHLRLVSNENAKLSMVTVLIDVLESKPFAVIAELLMWIGVPILYFQAVDFLWLGVPWELCGKFLMAGMLLTLARPLSLGLAYGIAYLEKI